MNKNILISDPDDKTVCLKECGEKYGVTFITCPYHFVFFPFYLTFLILSLKKPDAVILRYMNDNKKFSYSLILFLSRLLTILIVRIFRIKLIWFCHNINKETNENYPLLTKYIRYFLEKYSYRIYVMDRLLVPYAIKHFPRSEYKIDYINFGVRNNNFRNIKELDNSKLIDKINDLTNKRFKPDLIGFCPTNSGEKYVHINYAPKLVEAAKSIGFNLHIVLVGNLKDYLSGKNELRIELDKQENITLIDEFVDYNASEVSKYIDFYWRGLDDQSVSYSIYEAATNQKPTLALDFGFIGKAVKEYALGATVDSNMTNIFESLSSLNDWDKSNAKVFLKEHSWDFSVNKIRSIL
ncbi:glycosyltransferase [Vibrio alginolyticus]|uniref:glycosyltransferase n=1 Tax=Vibrio TaxID=662 RepID=UPI00146BA37C|nr:glycosyltransferase [Vibrio sp. 1167]MDW2301104.1 glycosyltransferase [Vibrio sp. 1167]NMT95776.1 glycosyltransferase [Vibrio alginolyticus]